MVRHRLSDLAQRLCLVFTCLALVFSALGSVADAASAHAHHGAITETAGHQMTGHGMTGHGHHGAHDDMPCCETGDAQPGACHAAACCAFADTIAFVPRGAVPVTMLARVRPADLPVIGDGPQRPERPPRTT